VVRVLRRFIDNPSEGHDIAARAIALAREKFSLPQIRERFWSTIDRALTP
jgi:hypothetical protein